MGILGEIAKGVAKELMPNTTKIVEEATKSSRQDKKNEERRS